MKRRIPTRILSLFLALVMLVSSVPAAAAAEIVQAGRALSITITPPESTTLTIGDTLQLEAAAEPTSEAVELNWSSSSPDVASVDADGVVTAAAPGQAVITVSFGRAVDSLTLTVEAGQEVPAETVLPSETEPTLETAPSAEEAATEPVPVETETIEAVAGVGRGSGETLPAETETEPVQETESADETLPAEETEPTEEAQPAELPYGLTGMPADYVLSEEEQARKESMAASSILTTLSTLIPGENYAENQILVSAATDEEAAVIAEAYNGELADYYRGMARIQLDTVTVYEAVEASLNPELNLPVASPNYRTQIDPVIISATDTDLSAAGIVPEEESWYSWVKENMENPDPALTNPRGSTYQWMHDTVDTYAAWGVTTGDAWVKVAVIDTGINANHEDLKGKVTSIDIGLGTSDGYGSNKQYDHGTHVAGIIAGSMDNGKGGAGIAPGVSIINIRVADSNGSMDDWDIREAIFEAVDAGAHVINMSLGGFCYNTYYNQYTGRYEQILSDAIDYALDNDVPIVAAMGNTGTNSMEYPAGLDGVIAVAATDSANSRATFSSYGAWADISAPGAGIYSSTSNGSYASYDGTSMAAPVVSGVIALYLSAMGGKTAYNSGRIDPAVIEKALKASATKISDSGMGAGVVNAARMLDDKPDVPFYAFYDPDANVFYDGALYLKYSKTVPCNYMICFFESETAFQYWSYGDDGDIILYTDNGKTPSVKDGDIINGTPVQDTDYAPGTSLEAYAGSSVTFKAARISGMGIMGKALSVKLTVAKGSDITGISIVGPKQLLSGKSADFTATVAPADIADQSVTWTISNYSTYSLSSAKISKTGKLTTPANASGWIEVTATSNADPSISATHRVTVKYLSPVKTMTLNSSQYECYVDGTFTLKPTMKDAYGSTIYASDIGVQWTSSNTAVATVDQSGNVTAHAKGSAVITCKALDGSNKSAKCNVTVKQQVTDIAITGAWSVGPGKSITLKATVYPKDASSKNVTWSLDSKTLDGKSLPYGISIDAKTGKLSVASYVSTGKTIIVYATAQDPYAVTVPYYVSIYDKCAKIYICCNDEALNTGCATGPNLKGTFELKNGATTNRIDRVDLFSIDLDSSMGVTSNGVENAVQLNYIFAQYVGETANPEAIWSSSNSSVASVDPLTGYVTAHKAGSATITVKAMDGSNKTASIKVNVTNPTSTISISSSALRMNSSMLYLAPGKSVTHKVNFAETFGKPSNQKVNWSVSVYKVDSKGNSTTYTDYFTSNKLISINASGKLTVNSKVANEIAKLPSGAYFSVSVKASATDGTSAQARVYYRLVPATTTITMDKTFFNMSSGYYVTAGSVYTGIAYFWSDQPNCCFTVTSSNSRIVSPYNDDTYPTVYRADKTDTTAPYLYAVSFVTSGEKTGSAKLTVKATDGTNKSCSFTVKVANP